MILAYRLFLLYFLYTFVRIVFYAFNYNILEIDSFYQSFILTLQSVLFDNYVILYTNVLFILLSLLPLGRIIYKRFYQNVLAFVYFSINSIALAFSFINVGYYKYRHSHLSYEILEEWQTVSNKTNIIGYFLKDHYILLIFFLVAIFLWIFLYYMVKLKENPTDDLLIKNRIYYISSLTLILGFLGFYRVVFFGFGMHVNPVSIKYSIRYLEKIQQSDYVLNAPFVIIKTHKEGIIQPAFYITNNEMHKYVSFKKQYKGSSGKGKPNVFLFILESFAKEYVGVFNEGAQIPNYEGYTPFIDSLAQHSLIFTNAHANGYRSPHGIASILSGIPSFSFGGFLSSPYVKQPITSSISLAREKGYKTLFFHGAEEGSMFLSNFVNILGVDRSYSKEDFLKTIPNGQLYDDGAWGISDLPFTNYAGHVLDTVKQPFFATLFTLTSHHPYKVPKPYENRFPEGNLPIHKTVGYTDYALKEFFKAFKDKPWFKNTLFIITADHTDQVYYDEYRKPINSQAIPIIIYDPNGRFKGKDARFAQQLDIYPTIVDYIGYDKPFRSWGSSLLEAPTDAFVMNYRNGMYRYMRGDYIFTFTEDKKEGFYHASDLGLNKNLLGSGLPQEEDFRKRAYAFLQNYKSSVAKFRLK